MVPLKAISMRYFKKVERASLNNEKIHFLRFKGNHQRPRSLQKKATERVASSVVLQLLTHVQLCVSNEQISYKYCSQHKSDQCVAGGRKHVQDGDAAHRPAPKFSLGIKVRVFLRIRNREVVRQSEEDWCGMLPLLRCGQLLNLLRVENPPIRQTWPTTGRTEREGPPLDQHHKKT